MGKTIQGKTDRLPDSGLYRILGTFGSQSRNATDIATDIATEVKAEPVAEPVARSQSNGSFQTGNQFAWAGGSKDADLVTLVTNRTEDIDLPLATFSSNFPALHLDPVKNRRIYTDMLIDRLK